MYKRTVSLLLVVVLILCLFPTFTIEVFAIDYSQLNCDSFISNLDHREYINRMMKYYISSDSNLQNALISGKSVIFMFEGGSDNFPNSTYEYKLSDIRDQGVVIVVKNNTAGYATVVSYSENCSSIPGDPKFAIQIDGTYPVYTWNHQGKYGALQIDQQGKAMCLYAPDSNPNGSIGTGSGMNIHTRSSNKAGGTYSDGSTWYWSEGCQVLGTGNDSSNYFNEFMKVVAGINYNVWTNYSSKQLSTLSSTGKNVGYYVIDRQLAKEGLRSIYNDTAISKIVATSNNASENASEVKIAFNANGGSCSTSTKTVSTGSAIGTLPYPIRDGYIFDGWYTASSGGTMINSDTTVSGNTTYYAHWSSEYEDLGTGFYASIKNINAGLGVVNNNGNVELGAYGAEDSIWYFERYSEGCYAILSAVDGLAMDVYNGDTHDGANIWVYEKNDTSAQKWFIRQTDSGYIFLAKSTGKALDIDGASVEFGCNAQLWTLNGTPAQVMDITEAYQVQYDANGGENTPQMQWKLDGYNLRLTDATPTRTGVEFAGWSAEKNASSAQYQPGDEYTANGNVTLYAVWGCNHSYKAVATEGNCQTPGYTTYTCTECGDAYTVYDGEVSEWSTTKPTGVDEDLIETKTQYRYADKETTTSYESSLSGWTKTGSSWQQSGSGSVEYVESWPSGFATSCWLYSLYNNTPKSASENETEKTVITGNNVSGYIYYHWCRGTYTSGPINRGSKNTQQGEYTAFHAFYSTTEPGSLTADDDGSVIHSNGDCCKDSYWYFYVPVYTQSYTTYRNLFSYERWGSWSDWSDTAYSGSDSRKVETRTLYRYVTPNNGKHNYSDGYCTLCGAVDPEFTFIPAVITPENVTGTKGSSITVPVMIEKNPGFSGFTFVINYDTDALVLTDIAKGDVLAESESGSFTKNVNGGVVTWTDVENLTNNGELLVLTFTILEDAVARNHEISLELKDGQSTNFVDENARAAHVEFAAGTVSVTEPKPVVTLTKIEITKTPNKTVYQIGESLDTTGLTLKATYSDGSTETITSGFVTSGFDSSTAGTKTVTVSYEGKTTSFAVKVEKSEEVDSNAPQIIVDTVTAREGETVNVAMSIKNNPGFGGMTYEVFYDNNELELISYEQDLGCEISTSSAIDQFPDKVRILYAGTENVTGDGILVTFTFKVKDSVSAGLSVISVVIEEGTAFTYEGRSEVDIDIFGINGGVEIVEYIPGDINGDGRVNSRDASRLMQHLAGWDVEVVEASLDVNGDGKVNSRDASRLMQYLAGWDVEIN